MKDPRIIGVILMGIMIFGHSPLTWAEDGAQSQRQMATPQQTNPGTKAPPAPAASKGSDSDFVTEKRSDGTTVKYKKKTSYDFEGSSIEGLYNKPSGSYISNIKDVKGKSIIRIRENFDAEVIDSSRLLK